MARGGLLEDTGLPAWSGLGLLLPPGMSGQWGTGWRIVMEGGGALDAGLFLPIHGMCGLRSLCPSLGLSFPTCTMK